MSIKNPNKIIILALLFWSAIFIVGCKEKKVVKSSADIRITMTSTNLTITQYKDGKMTYRFTTPHLTRYEGKGKSGMDTAYMIFDKGIDVVTFSDSTKQIESHVVSKWAVFRETENIWEARDSVVGLSADGKKLFTNLLFWDQNKHSIYSPIHTRVDSGEESVVGVNGFVSDEKMDDIVFNKSQGRFLIDTLSGAN
ncbi:MAG: LPS export ABC transporter periplasmic protein LptC [Rikenellaceae bacterium]